MHTVERFHNEMTATQVAAYLRTHGILATVIGNRTDMTGGLNGALTFGRGFFEVVISSKRLDQLAKAYIEEFLTDPPSLPDDWADEARPDLTRLDRALIPDCPGCGARLHASRPLGPCIACRKEYDLLELIFAKHGPEALASCYEQTDPLSLVTDDEILAYALDCPRCSYSLDGLPMQGKCPECGHGFDRRQIIDELFSSL